MAKKEAVDKIENMTDKSRGLQERGGRKVQFSLAVEKLLSF